MSKRDEKRKNKSKLFSGPLQTSGVSGKGVWWWVWRVKVLEVRGEGEWGYRVWGVREGEGIGGEGWTVNSAATPSWPYTQNPLGILFFFTLTYPCSLLAFHVLCRVKAELFSFVKEIPQEESLCVCICMYTVSLRQNSLPKWGKLLPPQFHPLPMIHFSCHNL